MTERIKNRENKELMRKWRKIHKKHRGDRTLTEEDDTNA